MGYLILLVVNFIAEYPNEVSSYLALEIIIEIQGTEEQGKDESDCQGMNIRSSQHCSGLCNWERYPHI